MHELAVMAQSIDEMKVNIAWITECFCSGVIIMFNVYHGLCFSLQATIRLSSDDCPLATPVGRRCSE